MNALRNLAGSFGFPVAVFLALVLLTSWLRYLVEAPEASSDGKYRHDPDYYVTDFKLIKYSADGRLQHELSADELKHFPDNDETIVRAPRLMHRPESGGSIYLTAEHASISSRGETLHLDGKVRIFRPDGALANEQIFTESLAVLPDAGVATSNVSVSIESPTMKLTGKGLSADFNERIFVLQEHTRGVFEAR